VNKDGIMSSFLWICLFVYFFRWILSWFIIEKFSMETW
jgi:hypothetical protein